MHKILKLLPLLFLVHQAQASELQINFSGEFNPATANTASLNDQSFNGQFNFDLTGGEYGSRGLTRSGRDNGRVELEYEDDASASVSFDGATYNVDQVELSFFDDYTPLGDQGDIDEHGWTGLFDTGTYDVFFLDGYLSTNEEEHHDLVDGLEFSIVYLFEQDQFSFAQIDSFAQNPDLNTMLLMGAYPIFRGFEFNQVNKITGAALHGAGKLTNMTVSAVPIPAAFWLFGSGLIGLVARRKRSQN